jgi:DNA-directed RNA polymerase specialized sigma24 family protein
MERCVDDSVPQLVRLAQRGDRNAFAELIRRYERTALSLALAITGQGEAADNSPSRTAT